MEIKFRAWNHNTESWEQDEFDTSHESELVNGAMVHYIMNTVFEETKSLYTFQQFTGLTDKNGKEIYDGDIITTPKGTCVVTFELGCFYAITGSRYRLGGWESNCLEIIGNIYEHSELINKKHEQRN